MILTCTCKHELQDKIHGKNRRVCNPTTKGTGRCTVCLSENGSNSVFKNKR